MGQVVRDLGMTMLVALVVHALYSARNNRRPPPAAPSASVYVSAGSAAPVPLSEQPPAGFSVFPWAP